jgi:hypothetical protein
VDDSATESETESDREYLGLPPLKQKTRRQDNIVSAHAGKNRAVDGEELAPDSDPDKTKYVSVKVQSEAPTLTARFHQSSLHSMGIRRKRSFEGKAFQLPAKRRHV